MPNVMQDIETIEIKLFLDGNQWCALIGQNIQDGLCGFGMGPAAALRELTAQMDFVRMAKAMEPPVPSKNFKVASISDNPNGFGLHGHILIASDGETWQVARCRCSPPEDAWQKGQVIQVQPDLHNRGHWQWAVLGCEIPEKMTNPPQAIIDEVWPKEKVTINNDKDMDKFVQSFGFKDKKEFYKMMSSVDIGTPGKMRAFEMWKNGDGTKAGLERLPVRKKQENA